MYVGVTSDLVTRIWQHKNDLSKGFSEQYQLHFLVHYEMHATMLEAITREKQLKKWNRDWKIKLVESVNENWDDLYEQITAKLQVGKIKMDSRLRGNDGSWEFVRIDCIILLRLRINE